MNRQTLIYYEADRPIFQVRNCLGMYSPLKLEYSVVSRWDWRIGNTSIILLLLLLYSVSLMWFAPIFA